MVPSPSLTRRGLLQAALLVPWREPAAGFALFGPPKYAAGFSHFDYVNSQAPIGGELWLTPATRNASFDKLNPFTLRGTAPPGWGRILAWPVPPSCRAATCSPCWAAR